MSRRVGEPGASVTPIDLFGPGASARQVAAALRRGDVVHDASFDAFLPAAVRRVSGQFWSPLRVAMRVGRWLDELGLAHVVDVGSGAGKLCVVAALVSQSRFTGVEQRSGLVAAARALARTFEVEDRVVFHERSIAAQGIPAADAYYLFNPFEENLHGPGDHIDETVALGLERYDHDVAVIEGLLDAMPAGTCVILYNGFGGRMPNSFDVVRHDGDPTRPLGVWRKSERAPSGVLDLG